ncbi:MAG: 50S ribosomal protein L9 [Eubacteriales bacterium]
MKVILTQDVKAQGKKGDIIEVSDGYARNFLLPKKLCVIADAKAVNEAKNKEASRLHKIETERAAATELAAKLETVLVKVAAASGSDDRLYGSITAKDIAEALKAQHGVDIDRRKLSLDSPIRAYGSYTVDAKLYTDVVAHINVLICKK